MRSFKDYMNQKVVNEMSDAERWRSSSGEETSSRRKDALGELFDIARIATERFPTRILTFLKGLGDDEIQDKIRQIENKGLFDAMRDRPNAPEGPESDGIERVVGSDADSVGSAGGED
jgi:hypothetical protein